MEGVFLKSNDLIQWSDSSHLIFSCWCCLGIWTFRFSNSTIMYRSHDLISYCDLKAFSYKTLRHYYLIWGNHNSSFTIVLVFCIAVSNFIFYKINICCKYHHSMLYLSYYEWEKYLKWPISSCLPKCPQNYRDGPG